jgi:hypothetical protein
VTDYSPVIGLVVLWAVCGVISSLIWQHRGGSAMSGFWIGAIAGVFGLVYVTVASPRTTASVWNPAAAAAREMRGEDQEGYQWVPPTGAPPPPPDAPPPPPPLPAPPA